MRAEEWAPAGPRGTSERYQDDNMSERCMKIGRDKIDEKKEQMKEKTT